MAVAWLINGWRQQERSAREITRALEIARERGMQSYNISRVGKSYWLVCSRETTLMYDLATTVRRRYAKVQHGIYLGFWREQLVAIVWRKDVLQHCLACSNDQDGIAHLQLLLERLTRKTRRQSALLLASSVPTQLQDYCVEHLAQWHLRAEQPDISEFAAEKRARLRDMSVPTPWQQRQRVLATVFFTLAVAAASGWYLWPQEPVSQHSQMSVQQALPDPIGVDPTVLTELPKLFFGMDHLAGWQWRTAALQGQELQVQLQPSYGRPEELAQQLDSAWQLQPQQQQALAKHSWPTTPFARQVNGFSIAQFDSADWQAQLKQYFPTLELRNGRSVQTQHYLQQVFTLKLAQTDFSELARLSHLLTHPHLRLVKLNLRAGQRLGSELEVHLYEPKPIAKEGAD